VKGAAELDRAIVAHGAKVRVLKTIDWPKALEVRFLERLRAGQPELPRPENAAPDLREQCAAFERIMARCDRGEPLGRFLHRSAWSYRVAAEMLMCVGRPRFTECSALLYGRPDFRFKTQSATNLDAAEQMLQITDDLVGGFKVPPVVADIPAAEFAARLRERIGGFFVDAAGDVGVEVVLDARIGAKAVAGSRKIKVREDALFSSLDLEQLAQHEAFVHTATLLNGKAQPRLTTLGLGAPRTTRTQEGLATFAEVITDAVDIARLRRLALRVRMVKAALDGADFIEVFRGFVAAGAAEDDAFRSAARVFRGGDPRGKVCFTKDAAYLEGTYAVSLFIRKALQQGRPELIPHLFAGRLTLGDAIDLAPRFADGTLAPARFVPPWAADPRRLLAVITFFTASSQFKLDALTLERFSAFEDEQIAASGLG
jgi:uncharacterized protein (TIGR02421 family)